MFRPGFQFVCSSLLSCIRQVVVNNKISIMEKRPILIFIIMFAATSANCAGKQNMKSYYPVIHRLRLLISLALFLKLNMIFSVNDNWLR